MIRARAFVCVWHLSGEDKPELRLGHSRTRHDAGARTRTTYGHSLAVDPWGAVLADAGDAPGVTLVDLPLDAVDAARAKVPSLANARAFAPPEG